MTNCKYEVGDCFYLRKESVYMKLFEDLLDLSNTVFIITSMSSSFFSTSIIDDEKGIEWPGSLPSARLKATTKEGNQICHIDYTEVELDRHFVIAHFTEEEKQKVLSMSLLVSEVDFE